MKIIITTDSNLLHTRLLTILSSLKRLDIVADAKSIEEALTMSKVLSPDVMIFSFHHYDQSAFEKLQEIKKEKDRPVIIVLTGTPYSQTLTRWNEAGADYTFDLAFQFNQMVDKLGELMDKNLYGLNQSVSKN